MNNINSGGGNRSNAPEGEFSINEIYYGDLIKQSDNLSSQLIIIKKVDIHNVSYPVIELCNRLLDELNNYIKIRRDDFIPYVLRMQQKKTEGHKCDKCTSNCGLRDTAQQLALTESYNKVKQILYYINTSILSMTKYVHFPDVFTILNSHLALLEATLTEIFAYEETCVKPYLSKINTGFYK